MTLGAARDPGSSPGTAAEDTMQQNTDTRLATALSQLPPLRRIACVLYLAGYRRHSAEQVTEARRLYALACRRLG